MAVEIARRLFTIDEFEKMIVSGVFPPDDRSELIRGEIVEMTPIGLRHASCVGRLTKLLERKFGDNAIVWVQNPIRLVGNSLPQPDVVLLKPRDDFYASSRPMPGDVSLVVEVSDSSLDYDVHVKAPLYAEAGIAVLWVVDLASDTILVHSNPTSSGYASIQRLNKGDEISLSREAPVTIAVIDILGLGRRERG